MASFTVTPEDVSAIAGALGHIEAELTPGEHALLSAVLCMGADAILASSSAEPVSPIVDRHQDSKSAGLTVTADRDDLPSIKQAFDDAFAPGSSDGGAAAMKQGISTGVTVGVNF